MTTISYTISPTHKPVTWLLVILMVATATLSAHAVAKHGSDAIAASMCTDRPEVRMINPETGRIALICWTERGWGVYIQTADGQNVTAFVKDKMRMLSDVIRYMRNAGYEVIQ